MRLSIDPEALELLHKRICQLAPLSADLMDPTAAPMRAAIGDAEAVVRRAEADLEKILTALPT